MYLYQLISTYLQMIIHFVKPTTVCFLCGGSFVRSFFLRSFVRSFVRSSLRRSKFDVRSSTFDVRCSTVDGRRSTVDVRCSMSDVRRSTVDVQRSTFVLFVCFVLFVVLLKRTIEPTNKRAKEQPTKSRSDNKVSTANISGCWVALSNQCCMACLPAPTSPIKHAQAAVRCL